MPKPPFNIAGAPPEDWAGLETIRKGLLSEPRKRRWVICEIVNHRTGIEHPLDDDDQPTPLIRFLTIEPVTDTHEIDQLQAMRDRARLNRPGQASFAEEAAQ